MRTPSLRLRLATVLMAAALAGVALQAGLTVWPLPQTLAWLDRIAGLGWAAPAPGGWAAGVLTLALLAALAAWLSGAMVAPLRRLIRALEGSVLSYRDGDFSVSIAPGADHELGELVRLHNALGVALRTQRQHLAQRELLLDTVVQNTPVALVLSDAAGRVAYANIAARQLLAGGRSLDGSDFHALLQQAPAGLRQAIAAGEDALFSVPLDDAQGGGEETFHLSQRGFQLQGRPHRLHLLRHMTRELSRQEVATWKRLIRVISHELNNSLAPISSLAHSGAELLRRGDLDRLPGVLATVGERARHLHAFIDGYARFAKLPTPQPEAVAWAPFLQTLAGHSGFRQAGDVPADPGWFDPAQMAQALINLLKNAHEAGGPAADITLAVATHRHEQRFEVADRGPGMSPAVLAQALLPFYSTKRSGAGGGTGLGLALAREIAEAHGGRIALANRDGGGLRVTLSLPPPPGPPV